MVELEGRRYVPSESVVSKAISDEETVLLDLRTEHYFAVNELGSRAWECLAADGSLDDLVEEIAGEWNEAPDVIRHDMGEFLDNLASAGLVQLQQGGS